MRKRCMYASTRPHRIGPPPHPYAYTNPTPTPTQHALTFYHIPPQQPYYDILPRTLANMPIFWSEVELAYLQGSYLLTQIEERKVKLRLFVIHVCGCGGDRRLVDGLRIFPPSQHTNESLISTHPPP